MRIFIILLTFIIMLFISNLSFGASCSGLPTHSDFPFTGTIEPGSKFVVANELYTVGAVVTTPSYECNNNLETFCQPVSNNAYNNTYMYPGNFLLQYRVVGSCNQVDGVFYNSLTQNCLNFTKEGCGSDPEHCTNNAKDYDEVGIDCEGSCSAACEDRCPPGTLRYQGPGGVGCAAWTYPNQYGGCPDGFNHNRCLSDCGSFPANQPICTASYPSILAAASANLPSYDVPPGWGPGTVNTIPSSDGVYHDSSSGTGTNSGNAPDNGSTPGNGSSGGSPGSPEGNTPGTSGSSGGSPGTSGSGTNPDDAGSYARSGITAYGDNRPNDVPLRFTQFIFDMRQTGLFSFEGAMGNIPSSGDSTMTINCGSWGLHTFDFAQYNTVYQVLSKMFYILTVFSCIKIVTKTGAHS